MLCLLFTIAMYSNQQSATLMHLIKLLIIIFSMVIPITYAQHSNTKMKHTERATECAIDQVHGKRYGAQMLTSNC